MGKKGKRSFRKLHCAVRAVAVAVTRYTKPARSVPEGIIRLQPELVKAMVWSPAPALGAGAAAPTVEP